MSKPMARALARTPCAVSALLAMAHATPSPTFPFNSQVPAVARVDQVYSFQLSESTFQTPDAEHLSYSVVNQPAWLNIDSATRTLFGTPGQGDVGSSDFLLTAADSSGAANMQCTMVVSREPAPQIVGDISGQLAATVNLSSSQPPVVTLLPLTSFTFEFRQESFIDIVQRKLYYYACLSDHTPLPAWLIFDAAELSFSGVAPDLSAFPQSWTIDLIASDVEGFAGSTASFTLAVGTQQLAFVPAEQTLNVTTGKHISFTALQHRLFLNGNELSPARLKAAVVASMPPWLTFDATTLAIRGTVPTNVTAQNMSVTVTDQLGNAATAVINIQPSNSTLFNGAVGTIVAEAGKALAYRFPESLFTEPDLILSVAFPESARWLMFDASKREISGTVPSATQASTIQATLTAKPSGGGEGQSEVFTINIKAAAVTGSDPTRSSTATSAPSTNVATSTPEVVVRKESDLSGGVIAAIVILSVLAAALLIVCFVWYCRRQRRNSYVEKSSSPSKKTISRPIPPSDNVDAITVTTELQRDVEKTAGQGVVLGAASPLDAKEEEPAPQIHLNLPSHSANKSLQWPTRMSQGSSLGVGEAAIRADSNIPEWGQAAVVLQTPHDSFAVPADLARVSRQLSQSSPTRRALKRLRNKHLSRGSIGLGISAIASDGIARHSSQRAGRHRRTRNSFGLSPTREAASSMASLSTRGTSVLSTKPSEFPMPPESTHSTSLSVPTFSISEADPQRKSIRLVERSDSVATDNRPIQDKRQSFIRNRASVGVPSPLFAHGSRASSSSTRPTNSRAANVSSAWSLQQARRPKNGKSIQTTYSESSSIGPQTYEPRKPQARSSKRFSQGVRTLFPLDHVRAPTRSTLDTDYQSAVEGESSSAFTTTSESMNSEDWMRAEMAKPRHERSWILPGEASPTPPPAPPTSRQQSESRHSTPSAEEGAPGQRWHRRLRDKSSSPLASQAQPAVRSSPSTTRKEKPTRLNRLSEPISLVSADSIHNGRSKTARGKGRRPVSVEEVQRLSSMMRDQDTATVAGSEVWDNVNTEGGLEDAGLVSRVKEGREREGTVKSARSDLSGPAFL